MKKWKDGKYTLIHLLASQIIFSIKFDHKENDSYLMLDIVIRA